MQNDVKQVSFVAKRAEYVEEVARTVAPHCTIQPARKRQSPKTLHVTCHRARLPKLSAVLGYLRRQGFLSHIRVMGDDGVTWVSAEESPHVAD